MNTTVFSPRSLLVNRRWTFSIASISCFRLGDHITEQYSTIGRTYTVFLLWFSVCPVLQPCIQRDVSLSNPLELQRTVAVSDCGRYDQDDGERETHQHATRLSWHNHWHWTRSGTDRTSCQLCKCKSYQLFDLGSTVGIGALQPTHNELIYTS